MENTIRELLADIENCVPLAKQKLDAFTQEYELHFPAVENPRKRGFADAVLWALMGGPVVLYSLGMNGSALSDLHSIVERYSVLKTPQFILKDNKTETAKRFLERKSLPEIGEILLECEVVNEQDVLWTKQITKLRNGYAHKNEKLIEKVTTPGRSIHTLDIDSEMRKIDCIHHIIAGIEFLYRIFAAEYEKSPSKKD